MEEARGQRPEASDAASTLSSASTATVPFQSSTGLDESPSLSSLASGLWPLASPLWILLDDRAGHNAQTLGVAVRLGIPYISKRLVFNRWAQLPAWLLGPRLCHVNARASDALSAPYPTLVIAAGRRMVPVLRALKKRSPATKTIYLMWPEIRAGLDLVVAPEYDHPPTAANILTTVAPLHAITPERLAAARAAPTLAGLPRPLVTLCLGGRTKLGDYNDAEWRDILTRAAALTGTGTLLVTTSRRTQEAALALIPPLLPTSHRFYRYAPDTENPYLGWLAAADAVIVTGDSLSMCAEACATGAPVFIYASPNVAPEKHRRLHQTLYTRGLAHPLDAAATLDWRPATPLDDVGHIANEIRARFLR